MDFDTAAIVTWVQKIWEAQGKESEVKEPQITLMRPPLYGVDLTYERIMRTPLKGPEYSGPEIPSYQTPPVRPSKLDVPGKPSEFFSQGAPEPRRSLLRASPGVDPVALKQDLESYLAECEKYCSELEAFHRNYPARLRAYEQEFSTYQKKIKEEQLQYQQALEKYNAQAKIRNKAPEEFFAQENHSLLLDLKQKLRDLSDLVLIQDQETRIRILLDQTSDDRRRAATEYEFFCAAYKRWEKFNTACQETFTLQGKSYRVVKIIPGRYLKEVRVFGGRSYCDGTCDTEMIEERHDAVSLYNRTRVVLEENKLYLYPAVHYDQKAIEPVKVELVEA